MTPNFSRRRTKLVALLAFLAFFAGAALPPAPARAQTPTPAPLGAAYVPGEVLIGWEPGQGPIPQVTPSERSLEEDAAQRPDWQAAVREISRQTGRPVIDAAPDAGTARLRVAVGDEVKEIARLSGLPWVNYAEPNYYAYAADAGAIYPNDPDFDLQWHAQRVAAPESWALTRGSLSFVVAVLDTGVARGHPEFAGKLMAGYNYLNPQAPPEDDDPEGHGTHVTGIIAAGFNNGIGVAGLAPDVKILPLKVLDSNRGGDYATISRAIREAAGSYRAQVINLSLVGLDYSQTLLDAVNEATGLGALVVAAAGNCGQSGQGCRGLVNPTIYPAAFPSALAVGASDRLDQPAPYSGYKPYVGIAAPGGTVDRQVLSTTRTGYGYLYGTSMSTPMVSAAAAMVWTLSPAATPGQIAEILKSTADKVGTFPFSGAALPYAGGRNDYFGAGRLNLARAVRQVYPPSLNGPGWQSVFLAGQRVRQTRILQVANPSGQAVFWQAVVLEGAPWLSVSPSSGTAIYGAPGQLTIQVNGSQLAPGSYFGRVQVQPVAPSGLTRVDIPIQLTVSADESRAYLPIVGRDIVPTWYDADSPDALYRADLNLVNDSISQMPLPFPVAFYGSTYNALQISDNGLVAFGSGNAPMRAPTYCPGNGAAPNGALYVFAADWDPTGGQVIVHQPHPDTFVVTWRDVRRATGTTRATFQLVLTDSSEFRGNYLLLDDPRGGIAGSEDESGILAESILCQTTGTEEALGKTIRFYPRVPWQ